MNYVNEMCQDHHPIARLFVEEPLMKGSRFTLSAKAQHYIAHVMRAKAGDILQLFNGKDGEWLGEIETISKKSAEVKLLKQTREQQPTPDIWLVFAPLKSKRLDFLVEKATELGASALCPVRTDHTNISRVSEEKLWLTAREAAEQTERLNIPEILPYQPLQQALANWPKNRLLFYGDETGEGDSIIETLEKTKTSLTSYAVMIGPEGGFSARELEYLRSLDYAIPVSLGPRVLRAETAALAMLTWMQVVYGDWTLRPSFRTRNNHKEKA